jgi:hypothetical protein
MDDRLRTPLWLVAAAAAGMAACDDGAGAPADAADTGTAGDGADLAPDEPDVAEAPADEAEEEAEEAEEAADVADAEAEAEIVLPGWQPPVEWRRPIDDYIAAVQETLDLEPDRFDHALKELEVFDDRLYLGYGDWTENTGSAVGIEVRYFDDPEGEVVSEFDTDEESIDYYRVWDDTLYIPGVDATEDALIGNVYVKPSGGTWTKVRSLEQNLHVLDVFGRDGAMYASGGGCDDMDHYYAGDDQGLVYRSEDGGATWAIDFEWHDGDTNAVVRYEYFAGVEDDFYVFGNTINATTYRLTNVPRRWDGGAWTPVDLLEDAWVQRTWQLDPTAAVARGVDLSTGTFRAWRILAGEATRALGRFDSLRHMPVDFFPVADDDMLILTREENRYPDEAEPPFGWHVWRTPDLFTLEELFTFSSDASFVCLALWRDAIYLGSTDGGIWRSEFVPE